MNSRYRGHRGWPYIFGITLLCLTLRCTPKSTTPMKEAEGNFIMLPPKASIYAYEGKDICIRGSASNLPYQHMIKGDFEKGEDYFYLDLKAGGQVVAYHRGLAIPDNGVEKWFCGRVGTVHGMTKRGDQKYSECYLQVVEIRD